MNASRMINFDQLYTTYFSLIANKSLCCPTLPLSDKLVTEHEISVKSKFCMSFTRYCDHVKCAKQKLSPTGLQDLHPTCDYCNAEGAILYMHDIFCGPKRNNWLARSNIRIEDSRTPRKA